MLFRVLTRECCIPSIQKSLLIRSSRCQVKTTSQLLRSSPRPPKFIEFSCKFSSSSRSMQFYQELIRTAIETKKNSISNDKLYQYDMKAYAQKRNPSWADVILPWVKAAIVPLIALLAFLYAAISLSNTYLVGYTVISGTSMQPTLNPYPYEQDDLVLINHLFEYDDIKRGDIVVFRSMADPSEMVVKRVIGLAGDVITTSAGSKLTIPTGHSWMAGDNTKTVDDSKTRPIPLGMICGKAAAVIYPFKRFCWLDRKLPHDRVLINQNNNPNDSKLPALS